MKRNSTARSLVFLGVLTILAALSCLLPVDGALTSSIQTTVKSKHTSTAGLATANDTVGYSVDRSFQNGSGTSQVADLVYHTTGTLTAGGQAAFDLAGGLTDSFGQTITMVRIKSILFENTSGSMTVAIGNATNPVEIFSPDSGTLLVPPYGVFSWTAPAAGVAIGAGSSDELLLTNSAGDTCGYKIWIVGASN